MSLVGRNGERAPSRGLYREERHQSPFSIKTEVESAFNDLFEYTKKKRVPLILSYSGFSQGTAARPKPRMLTLSELEDIARMYFSKVEVSSAGQVSHSKFNSKELNVDSNEEAESFVVAVP
jgi:hypothetical protein